MRSRSPLTAPRNACKSLDAHSVRIYSVGKDIDMGWQAAGKGGAVAAGKQESVDAGISILEAGVPQPTRRSGRFWR